MTRVRPAEASSSPFLARSTPVAAGQGGRGHCGVRPSGSSSLPWLHMACDRSTCRLEERERRGVRSAASAATRLPPANRPPSKIGAEGGLPWPRGAGFSGVRGAPGGQGPGRPPAVGSARKTPRHNRGLSWVPEESRADSQPCGTSMSAWESQLLPQRGTGNLPFPTPRPQDWCLSTRTKLPIQRHTPHASGRPGNGLSE